MEERMCTKCQCVYPATLEYFRPQKEYKCGLKAECRSCSSLREAEFRKRHPEKINANTRAYRKAHPEWSKEVKQRHYQKHREEVIAKSRQYRQDNPLYWKRKPEKEAEKSAKRQARKRNAAGFYTAKDACRKYQEQQGECFYCHKPLGGSFHVDHYIPLIRGGTNWPDNIVIACSHCNLTKGDRMPGDFVARFL